MQDYFEVGTTWVERQTLRTLLISGFPNITTWVGSPYYVLPCEKSTVCQLDTSPAFDLFDTNPRLMGPSTWVAELQAVLDKKKNSTGWQAAWASLLLQRRKKVHSIAQSPGSVWLLRGNRLYTIGLSGVQVRSKEEGLCMPSGIALCRPYTWAMAGHLCRPCGSAPVTDEEQWAWAVQCQQRHSLAMPPPIRLSVSNRLALADIPCAQRPSATYTTAAGGEGWDVEIRTTDPAACIRQLLQRLSPYQILSSPRLIIIREPLLLAMNGSGPSHHTKKGRLAVNSILGGAVGCLVLLILMGLLYADGVCSSAPPHTKRAPRKHSSYQQLQKQQRYAHTYE
jgi:hypothetical protein